MKLVLLHHSLHTSLLSSIISCMSAYYRCTLKTREFRTKDFVVRSAHSIEHQKCKYCVGRQGVRIRSSCLGKRQSRTVNFELGIILGFACDFELFSCELQQTRQTYTLQPCHVPSSYVRQHCGDYYSDNLPCLLPLSAFVVIV